jgi:hypothetical protein
MPTYEEVMQRAWSLQAMTALTEPEFMALLPPFEDTLAAYLQDRTSMANPVRTVIRVPIARVLDPPSPTNCYSF